MTYCRCYSSKYLLRYELKPECGQICAFLTAGVGLNINCFQLASVILKQYVEAHWNSSAEKFRPPKTTDAVSTFLVYFKSYSGKCKSSLWSNLMSFLFQFPYKGMAIFIF